MTNKKSKIVNWLSVAISAVILILECMPKSVQLVGYIGPREYEITYVSYFTPPQAWANWDPLIAIIIAFLTIFSLLFNIIILIKDGKSLTVANMVLTSLALVGSTLYVISFWRFVSAYNVAIMILFLGLMVLQSIKMEKYTKRRVKCND